MKLAGLTCEPGSIVMGKARKLLLWIGQASDLIAAGAIKLADELLNAQLME